MINSDWLLSMTNWQIRSTQRTPRFPLSAGMLVWVDGTSRKSGAIVALRDGIFDFDTGKAELIVAVEAEKIRARG